MERCVHRCRRARGERDARARCELGDRGPRAVHPRVLLPSSRRWTSRRSPPASDPRWWVARPADLPHSTSRLRSPPRSARREPASGRGWTRARPARTGTSRTGPAGTPAARHFSSGGPRVPTEGDRGRRPGGVRGAPGGGGGADRPGRYRPRVGPPGRGHQGVPRRGGAPGAALGGGRPRGELRGRAARQVAGVRSGARCTGGTRTRLALPRRGAAKQGGATRPGGRVLAVGRASRRGPGHRPPPTGGDRARAGRHRRPPGSWRLRAGPRAIWWRPCGTRTSTWPA